MVTCDLGIVLATSMRRVSRLLGCLGFGMVIFTALLASESRSVPTAQDLEFLRTSPVKRIGPLTVLGDQPIWMVKEDRFGFIWIGTIFKLYRFDGKEFVDYTPLFNLPSDSHEKLVDDMLEDRYGNMWIGCRQNLFRHDLETERIELMKGVGGLSKLFEDAWGRLYVFGHDGSLKVFRFAEGQLRELRFPDLDRLRAEGVAFSCVAFGRKGQGKLVGLDGRIFALNAAADSIEVDFDATDRLGSGAELTVYSSLIQGDILWVACDPGGVFRVDLRSGEPRSVGSRLYGKPNRGGKRARKLVSDAEGRIWTTFMDGPGLCIYMPGLDAFEPISYIKGNLADEGRDVPISVEFDGGGNIWVGTLDLGLFVIKAKPSLLRYENLLSASFDYSSSLVRSYLELTSGDKLVGIRGLGICRKLSDGPLLEESFACGRENLAPYQATDLLEDPYGKVWINAFDAVYVLDPVTGDCLEIKDGRQSDLGSGVMLLRGREMWVGTWGRVTRIDLESKRILGVIPTIPSTIQGMAEDSRGRVWICARKGLMIYDPKTEQFAEVRSDGQGDPRLLVNHWTTDVKFDEEGTAWVSTYGIGLRRFDLDFQLLLSLDARNGLPSEAIASMQFDHDGLLWMATRSGIATLDPDSLEVERYQTEDWLMDNRFSPARSFRKADGSLVFVSQKGVVHVDPQWRRARPLALVPQLTGISILDKPVPVGGEGDPLKQSILLAEDLVLESHQSVFKVSFTATNTFATSAAVELSFNIISNQKPSISAPTFWYPDQRGSIERRLRPH